MEELLTLGVSVAVARVDSVLRIAVHWNTVCGRVLLFGDKICLSSEGTSAWPGAGYKCRQVGTVLGTDMWRCI
jgi:hypothetical protein